MHLRRVSIDIIMTIHSMPRSFSDQFVIFINGVFREEVLEPGGHNSFFKEKFEVGELCHPSGNRLFIRRELRGFQAT